MKLKTLENQLQRFADAKELSLEDALVILNAVYDAFSYDVEFTLTCKLMLARVTMSPVLIDIGTSGCKSR